MVNNNEQKWFALEITTEVRAAEAIEFALNELDSLGTEINIFDLNQVAEIKVVGYFTEKSADENIRIQINEALRVYGFQSAAVKDFEWREVENQDWLEEWKKHWKPTETEKFIIAAPWEKLENTGRIVIRIEPNMAFGTGTHETTRLCLRAIEEDYAPGMSFFDVGTGTGILAIAVSKLAAEQKKFLIESMPENSTASAAKISGCDTDRDSIKIARENAVLNRADEIDLFVGSISGKTPQFDFVCANLTAGAIVPLLPLLLEKTRKILFLSGILVEQENLLAAALRSLGIEDYTRTTDGEWISIKWKMDNR